ncbi:MAG: hypothetical protein QW303_09310 [Nitrososphaerota archaeon]
MSDSTTTTWQDAYKAGAEASARVIRLNQLFEKYAGNLNERDQLAFAGLLRVKYEQIMATGDPIDDEKIFQEISERFTVPEEKKEKEVKEIKEEEDKKNETKEKEESAPKGKADVRATKVVEVKPLEETEHILADDDKYFEMREKFFNQLRNYKLNMKT